MKDSYQLKVIVLTKDRPSKLMLTLQSLINSTANSFFSVEVYDAGDRPATEDSSLRNVIDLASRMYNMDISVKRIRNISIQENRKSILKGRDKDLCIIDDDIILDRNCLDKLFKALNSTDTNYVVPVCIDINNSLRHPDYTLEYTPIDEMLKMPVRLRRHRLYYEDRIVAVPYAEASTLMIKGSALKELNWDFVRSGENDMIEGVKLTKALEIGHIVTQAISYHNTDAQEWFTNWRKTFTSYVDREFKANDIS